jgi:FAD/FMN-containing dehydrogenase
MKRTRLPRAKLARRSAALLALTSVGVVGGQKVVQLSADPVGPKDCAPVLPAAALDGTAPSPALVDSSAPNVLVRHVRQQSPLAWVQRGGTINDASCLNRTEVHGIVRVRSVEDLQNALTYARSKGFKVAIAGVRHSMGGQAFARDAVVLDMTSFNAMSLDENTRVLTVQSGATWHAIQNYLHPRFAVKAMQSTDIFTVGGSIAVNAHGMDHNVGALGRTIRSMRVLLPDGTLVTTSRDERPELFGLVVGGYGLFGIVVDVQLDITDNVVYEAGRRVVEVEEFPSLWNDEFVGDGSLGLFYGHLSTAPQSFLREMILYTYHETPAEGAEIPPLGEVSNTKLRRFVLNFSKYGSFAMRLKWWAEKHLEPRFESCSINRNQAMTDGEACLVSRNEPMHDSVKYLQNNLPNDTDILQEYFVPRAQLVPFVDGVREIMLRNEANLLNASVRVVHKEDAFLNYAPEDMFSIVLYLNQRTDAEDSARMATVTRELIDLTTQHGGRFFLPYQLGYSAEQLRAAYPEIDDFFAAKRRYDPNLLLTNTWYERYAPALAQ